MAKASPRPWTLDEFLAWDDGTDQRYELVRGEVVAMAPPGIGHGTIVMNLALRIGSQLRPPCRVVGEAGIVLPDRSDSFYQAGFIVSCTEPEPGQQYEQRPRLIAEILSPSTSARDRGLKLDDYCSLPSVEEIVLVWSEERRVQHWRREGDHWAVRNLIGEAALALAIVPEPIPLQTIYADSGI